MEEIFENERKSLLGVFTKKNLLYTDKSGTWSTRDLVPKTKDQIELPPTWKWVTEWEVETDENIEEDDGWRVGLSVLFLFLFFGPYHTLQLSSSFRFLCSTPLILTRRGR